MPSASQKAKGKSVAIHLRYPDARIVSGIASAGRFTPRERREAELRLWRSGLALVVDPDQRAWLEAAIADTDAEIEAMKGVGFADALSN